MSSSDFTPPDNRPALVESGLRRFLAGGFRLAVLYTQGRRYNPQWKGLTGAEADLLIERKLATSTKVDSEGRCRITLTAEGGRQRDALRRGLKSPSCRTPAAAAPPAARVVGTAGTSANDRNTKGEP